MNTDIKQSVEITHHIFTSIQNSQDIEVNNSEHWKGFQLDMQRYALNFFNKMDILLTIETKYIRKQEIKLKLNSTHFIDLGIPVKKVGVARESFVKYIIIQIGSSGGSDGEGSGNGNNNDNNKDNANSCVNQHQNTNTNTNLNAETLPLSVLYEQFDILLEKESKETIYEYLLEWYRDVWVSVGVTGSDTNTNTVNK